jgi:hypothetical protein
MPQGDVRGLYERTDAGARLTIALRRGLAKRIGIKFCNCGNMIPLGPQASFDVPSFLPNPFVARLCDLAWRAVARQIHAAAGWPNVIDHAWLVGFKDEPREPWALVTEPYITEDAGTTLIASANRAMFQWGIQVHLLPTADSALAPGRCRPVVATLDDGWAGAFVRAAVPWELNALG